MCLQRKGIANETSCDANHPPVPVPPPPSQHQTKTFERSPRTRTLRLHFLRSCLRMSVTRALGGFLSCLRCHSANDGRFEFSRQIDGFPWTKGRARFSSKRNCFEFGVGHLLFRPFPSSRKRTSRKLIRSPAKSIRYPLDSLKNVFPSVSK